MNIEFPDQPDPFIGRDSKGRVAFGVCLRTTLYFGAASSSAIREALLSIVSDYIEQTPPGITRCSVPWGKSWVSFKSALPKELASWVRNASANTPWDFAATGSDDEYEASPFHIEILAAAEWQENPPRNKLSYLTATFPLTWFSQRVQGMTALVLEWSNRLHALHGFGGLAFYYPTSRAACSDVERELFSLALRFPGVELDYPVNQVRDLSKDMKGVNWLTAVGVPLISRLGGIEALRANVTADTEFHDYAGGTLIQLGADPQLGDTSRGKIPDSYRNLSRALKGTRVVPKRGWGNSADSGFDLSGTTQLLSRFDTE